MCLEPKYKKVRHQIKNGETFDSILEQYSIDQKEIKDIKEYSNISLSISIIQNGKNFANVGE